MRPPSQFGNDITNQNNNNNNTNNNDDNNDDGFELPPSVAHLGGTLIFTRQAGRAVIRVVGRCEDAKENGSALGESSVDLSVTTSSKSEDKEPRSLYEELIGPGD